jgi:hypothetical protein
VADDVAFRVEGLREFITALRRATDVEVPKAIRQANLSAAKTIADAARPQLPVRSGALQGSLRPLATQQASRVVLGNARVPYANAIHWGTGPREGQRGPHNIKGRPVLWLARQRFAEQVRAEYEKQLREILRRV